MDCPWATIGPQMASPGPTVQMWPIQRSIQTQRDKWPRTYVSGSLPWTWPDFIKDQGCQGQDSRGPPARHCGLWSWGYSSAKSSSDNAYFVKSEQQNVQKGQRGNQKKAKPVAVTQRAGSAERPNYMSSDLNSSRHFCNPILTINKEYNKSLQDLCQSKTPICQLRCQFASKRRTFCQFQTWSSLGFRSLYVKI